MSILIFFKEEEVVVKPAPIVYTPTPRAVLEAEYKKLLPAPVPKKPKLEYVPKPARGKGTSDFTYVPSPITNDVSENSEIEIANTSNGTHENEKPVYIPAKIPDPPSPKNAIQEKEKHISIKEKTDEKDKERKSSRSSSSSSKEKKSSSTSRSKSSSHHSTKSRESSSSRSSSKHSSSKSSSSSSRSKHSSSSKKEVCSTTSEATSSKSNDKKRKVTDGKDVKEVKKVRNVSPSNIFDTDSNDEDEIMKQCRMIFEEFTPEENQKEENTEKSIDMDTSGLTQIDMFSEEALGKKRKAHEGGHRPHSKGIPQNITRKPNHVQNAMKSIYLRQEAVRKEQEAKVAAEQKKEEEVTEIMSRKIDLEIALSKTTVADSSSSSRMAHTPPSIMTPPTSSTKIVGKFLYVFSLLVA